MPAFVHLVRHGEVENPRALSYGRLPGFPLSEEGRKQAELAGLYLRARRERVERIVTSPLERAQETAAILQRVLDGPSPAIDERLIESSSWRDGLPRALGPIAWARRYFNANERAKSERPDEIATRMHAAIVDVLAALPSDGASAILVSHQTPISFAKVAFDHGLETFGFARLGNVTPWMFVRGACDLASVTTLTFEPGAKASFRYFAP